MADLKKFLDQAGVSTLWSRVAEKVAAEEARAKSAETANAAAAKKAQDEVDALELYVGTIPADYTVSNIVAFIQKRAEEVLAAANGGSSETAASVAAALDSYKALNDPKVQKNADDIAAIVADYLKAADKTELSNSIAANANEIIRIDNALKAAVENDGEGLDSIKELATWIEVHGSEAAAYAAAIEALELLVGEKAVATQIAEAIATENLAQYATDEDLTNLQNAVNTKVDTGDKTVSAYVAAAIEALKIADYAKAADLTLLAGRVTTLEGAGYQNAEQVSTAIDNKIASLKAENLWDTKGAAATAEANANAYADGLAKNYDAAGTAAAEMAKIQALSTAEIDAAIAVASN